VEGEVDRPQLLLVGAGGHARASADVIEREGCYEIVGLVGTETELGQSRFGFKVIATDSNWDLLARDYRYAFIGIGQIKAPDVRMSLYRQLVDLGFELPAVISPFSYVSRGTLIGPGTIVMHGAIINSGARIGANCIINSRALIEHDAVVSDHCHISTGVIINGDVRIGIGSFIGSGSVIKEGVSIGNCCLVRMNSSIRADLPDNSRP
jgi:sugar O-acyltransferase (sialic acid O-acetyltransferase NeuD family)